MDICCPSPWFAEAELVTEDPSLMHQLEMGALDLLDQQFLDEFLVGEFPQDSSSSENHALLGPSQSRATTVQDTQSSTTPSSPAEELVKVHRTINASSPRVAARLARVDSAGSEMQVVGGFGGSTQKSDSGSSGAPKGPHRVAGTGTPPPTMMAAAAAVVTAVPSVATAKTPGQVLDHTMAERRRREKLSQRFVELCAVVPGLKRMDKASLLTDAIKYLKELQGRVKYLEEQALKKSTCDSVVLDKKSQLPVNDESCSSMPKESKVAHQIEVKVYDRTIVVRIVCKNQKGFLVKALVEMEKLHLLVASMSVLPVVDSMIDITIIAQMGEEFLPVKDLIKILRPAFNEFV